MRFLLRPGWLAFIALVVGFAVACYALLAPWQFGREEQREAQERAIASADATPLRGIPHLVVWGDHMAGNAFWTGVRANVSRWQEQIRAAGGTADTLDLPASGIAGNSHMPMIDTNSDEIAGRIQAWMEEKGLMR